MYRRSLISFFFVSMLLSLSAGAAIEVHEFSSADNKLRYDKFTEELRCPLCKNHNLAGTNSQIAIDLRRELHRMVEEGQDDNQIVEFMVSRYGDFVLYRPRFMRSNYALWGGPLALILIGGISIGFIVWRRRRVNEQKVELTDGEKEALEHMLGGLKK